MDFYLGGTLFEKYVQQHRYEEFRELCAKYGCKFVEVSNGTIDLSNDDKAEYVKRLSDDFFVISEVGSKDQEASDLMAPNKWVSYINADVDAGAVLVTLETREGGKGGICRSNGELRYGLIEEILSAKIDYSKLPLRGSLDRTPDVLRTAHRLGREPRQHCDHRHHPPRNDPARTA